MNYPTNFRYLDGSNGNSQTAMNNNCPCKARREATEQQQQQQQQQPPQPQAECRPPENESYRDPPPIICPCGARMTQQQYSSTASSNYESYRELPSSIPCPCKGNRSEGNAGRGCACKMKRDGMEGQHPLEGTHVCVCTAKRQAAESQPAPQSEGYGRPIDQDTCDSPQQVEPPAPVKTCPCKAKKLAAAAAQQNSEQEPPQPPPPKKCPCKAKREAAARERQPPPAEAMPECFKEPPKPQPQPQYAPPPCSCKSKRIERVEAPPDRCTDPPRPQTPTPTPTPTPTTTSTAIPPCSCKTRKMDNQYQQQQQQVMPALPKPPSQTCHPPSQLTTSALAAATAANVSRNLCGPTVGPFQVQGIATIQPIISGMSAASTYSSCPCRKRIHPEQQQKAQLPPCTCGTLQLATITTSSAMNVSDDEYFSLSSLSSENDDAYHMSHKITYTCTSQSTQKSTIASATSQGTANTTTMESTSVSQARNATILHLLHEVVHLINKDDIQAVDIAPTRMRNIGHYGKEDSACDNGPFISSLKAHFPDEPKPSSMLSDPSCGMSGTLVNPPPTGPMPMALPVQYDMQPVTIPLQYPCNLIIAPAGISIQPYSANIPSSQALDSSTYSSQQALPSTCPCQNRPLAKKSPDCSNITTDELSRVESRTERAKDIQLIEEIAALAMDNTALCKDKSENTVRTTESQMESQTDERSKTFSQGQCICPVHGIPVPQAQCNADIIFANEMCESETGNVTEPLIEEDDCEQCGEPSTDCGPLNVPPVDCSKFDCGQEMDFMRLDCPQTQLDGGRMDCMPAECLDYTSQPTMTLSQGCVNPDCANYQVSMGTSMTQSGMQQGSSRHSPSQCDNMDDGHNRTDGGYLQPIECNEAECQCCHCRAMRDQQHRNNCMTIATPNQLDLERKTSCSELKFFIDSIIMDLDAMQNARRKKQMEQNLCPPKQPQPCPRQGFPVTITEVSDLGTTSLYVKWTIHDCFGIGGYEIYVDGYLTNRYFHFNHEAAVICDVDVMTPHKIVLLAQPKNIERFDDLYGCPGTGEKSKQLLRPGDCPSPEKAPCANWVPSIYLYDPCSRLEPNKCPC